MIFSYSPTTALLLAITNSSSCWSPIWKSLICSSLEGEDKKNKSWDGHLGGLGPPSASASVKMPLGSYAAEVLLSTLLHYLAIRFKSWDELLLSRYYFSFIHLIHIFPLSTCHCKLIVCWISNTLWRQKPSSWLCHEACPPCPIFFTISAGPGCSQCVAPFAISRRMIQD